MLAFLRNGGGLARSAGDMAVLRLARISHRTMAKSRFSWHN